MKIPKTSRDLPYIEFRIDKKGRMTLKAAAQWYGGIKDGFVCSDGSEGNTCSPKDLEKYIKAFKQNKIKLIEKEIVKLQKKLEKLKV